MNMTVLYKKCTYRLLLITTTLIGLGITSFSNAFDCNSSYSVNLDSDSLFVPVYITSSKNASRGMFTDGNKTYFLSFFDGIATFLMDNNVPVIGPVVFSGGSTVSYSLVDINSQFDTCQIEIVSLSSNSVGGSCDYSDYELKTDITENYCKNKFSSLMNSSECDSLYSGYVSPTLYQNCTNSLNSCSGELGVCNGNLNSCLNGNYTGNVMWSSLYINNIQHLSNENIYITIPEEIERDYINIDDETDIEITGYGYDQNAMQEMVNTQFTPPTSTDMEEIIKKIADFLPLLAVGLLFIWTWYIIKKVFRKGF